MTLKVIFAGTPEFAVPALFALHQVGHDIVMVLTQPDRASGRGLKLRSSAVKDAALQLGLPLMQPETLKDQPVVEKLSALNADVMVVAAYGLILPETILSMPKMGCLNIHASLLPRWRGAAPIQRAIEAGDSETGVCIMQMDTGLDTGDVWRRKACVIDDSMTAADIHDQLAQMGATEIVAHLQQPHAQIPQKQPEAGITYAKKIGKEDAYLRFDQPARLLVRQVHAFNPFPGAWTTYRDRLLKVWRAEVVDFPIKNSKPGAILAARDDAFVVAAQDRAVAFLQLQTAGGKRMKTEDFLRGQSFDVGAYLGNAS